jgi:hypothetical protein
VACVVLAAGGVELGGEGAAVGVHGRHSARAAAP